MTVHHIAGRHIPYPIATAESIRRSIRAIEQANHCDGLPVSNRAHNVEIVRTLRQLLEVRR